MLRLSVSHSVLSKPSDFIHLPSMGKEDFDVKRQIPTLLHNATGGILVSVLYCILSSPNYLLRNWQTPHPFLNMGEVLPGWGNNLGAFLELSF